MTLDNLTNTQFALLTLTSLGAIYVLTVMIKLAKENREEKKQREQ